LYKGFSNDVNLKEEEKVDILIHEIIGVMASDESMMGVLIDAQKRLIKKGSIILPNYIWTNCVPCEAV